MMSIPKKIISFVFLIALIIAVFFFFEWRSSQKYSRLSGTVQRIEGNKLSVYGIYNVDIGKKDLEIVEIKIVDGTKIEKTTFVIPPGGAVFEVDKLPKEVKEVDFSVLRKDYQNASVGIEVDLEANFLFGVDRVAKSIRYKVPKY